MENSKIDKLKGILMETQFPVTEDFLSLQKVETSQKLIKKIAKRTYRLYGKSLTLAGIDIEDVESIFMCNAYVFFSRGGAEDVLGSFLRQRGSKLNEKYKTLSQLDLDQLLMNGPDTPEMEIIGEEEARKKIDSTYLNLIASNEEYIEKFATKNRQDFGEVAEVAVDYALDFAGSRLHNDPAVDSARFKRALMVKLSRTFSKNGFQDE